MSTASTWVPAARPPLHPITTCPTTRRDTNSNDGILADVPTLSNTFSSNVLKHDVLWGAQDNFVRFRDRRYGEHLDQQRVCAGPRRDSARSLLTHRGFGS